MIKSNFPGARTKPIVFLHIATINNFQEIFDELLVKLTRSGLFPLNAELVLGIVGDGQLDLPKNLVCTVYRDALVETGEFFTLGLIKDFVQNNPGHYPVAYLHSKGVTSPKNKCIGDWRDYMSYFTVMRWVDALEILKSCDAVGVDLQVNPALHYSGNYWWANSTYLVKLPEMPDLKLSYLARLLTPRHAAEFWLGSSGGVFESLWDSGIPPLEHHRRRYPESRYRNSQKRWRFLFRRTSQ